MFNRDRDSHLTLALGAAVLLLGCSGTEPSEKVPLDESTQAASAYNGNGWNGNGWNGLAYNGNGWNGNGWNGNGWNGNGWNGNGWNGNGWNGNGWNGNSWGGTGSAQDCQITPNNDSCTTLHDWVNHTDVNGNGIAGDNDDKGARVQALSYWVNCACPAGVNIPFSDTHGLISTTFYGGLGLAPTWCGSDTSAQVPTSEMEIVSACLMARINMKGKHYPLSLRSLEPGTAVTTNEQLTHNEPLAWYWGNLWKQPHLDFDSTTFIDPDLSASGGWWWNMERFSCSAATDVLKDQALYGRDCDSSDCGGHLEFLGDCGSGKKMLGNSGPWNPNAPGNNYYKAVAATVFQAGQPGGLGSASGASSGGTTTATATYRGRSWRVMTLNRPETLSLEQPMLNFLNGSYGQVQLESGSIPAAQITYCTLDNPCEGGIPDDERGRKLLGLNNTQSISVTLSGNKSSPWNIPGNPTEAMSVAIRYARPGKLGDGQCDPSAGCMQTTWTECASGSVGAKGCIGGADSFGQLRIWVMSNTPYNVGWNPVHGSISPYGKNIFPATGSATTYNTTYIYPIYTQDSMSTVDGGSDGTPGVTYDTLRMWLSGDTANATDAPQLDTAYYLPGPPPGDADCHGPSGCWLFAGPNRSVSLAQNAESSYTSPPLPGGTYTFRIANVTGDADLYVKVNGPATINSWDCRPYLGTGAAESCTITLPGSGGTISATVRGYSSTSSATLIGNN